MPGSELGEKAIFNVVRTIQSPEAREEYLRQVCGDDEELRNRVSVLLHGFEAEESFLESPAAGVAATIQTLSEQEGDSIGPYKLIEQIGEGGMGVVYMAEQKKPVRRKVALKIIKPGMDTKQVVARFEAERQALALMNHPNVAKVLDAGATDSGRPYFVMELVRGIPLTEFCDQQKYDTRRRLELFATVCQAVQHAHQKGIIHRDIKPTNVLVELHDVTAVPKVIDFGVAKATTHNLTEHSIHTGFSQMIGTPLYMSPEQAELSGLDVDTRTDIYSLGVLLYELLTGTTPFDRETLKQAGYDEMRRIIREDDPAKPSARISTLAAESLSTISERRSCDPRRLGQTVRGELDWIAMKSLEKDRTRRYETASALAADIERHLTDQPVIACPPTTTYRMTKFARRNKFALCVGGLLASVLLAGVVGLFVSNQLIAQQKEEADRQRNIADENFRQAREAVNEYLLKVSNETLLEIPELQPLRKDLMGLARNYYQGFVKERGDDPTLRDDLAATLVSLGQIEDQIGTKETAIDYFQESLEIYQELFDAKPDSLDARSDVQAAYFRLGTQHFFNGQNQEALATLKESLRRMNELVEKDSANSGYVARLAQCYQVYGHTLWRDGARDASKIAYARSLEIMEDLVGKYPEEPSYKKSLAAAYVRLGSMSAERIAKAEAVMEGLVEDQPTDGNRSRLALIYSYKAAVQLSRKDTEGALATIQQATDIAEGLVTRNTLNSDYHDTLGECLELFSVIHARRGNYEEAEDVSRRFVEAMERLAEKNTELAGYHEQITRHLIRLGREYRTASDLARAGEVFLEAITNCEQAVAKRPQYLSQLNCTFFIVAVREFIDVLAELDRSEEVEAILRERLNEWNRIRDNSGEQEIWCLSVEMKLHYIMSRWLSEKGDSVEADLHLEQAYVLSNRAVELEPEQGTMEEAIARHHWNLFAIRFFRNRNWQGAEAVGRMAVDLPSPNHMEAFLWLGGKKEEYRDFCRSQIVGLPVEPGPIPAGFDDFRPARNDPNVVRVCTLDPMAGGDPERVLQIALRAMEEAPDDIPAFYHLALGRAYYRAGKHDLAIAELEKIISNPKNTSLAVVYLDLAIAHQLKGDHDKAKERLDQATSLIDEIEARDFFGDEIHPPEKTEIAVLRIEAELLILERRTSQGVNQQGVNGEGEERTPVAAPRHRTTTN